MAHPKQVKARVQAEFLTGNSLTQISRALGVPMGTIHRWVSQIPRNELDRLREKRERDLAEMLLDCVEESVNSFAAICREVRKAEYLKNQNIGQVAIFVGVTMDKCFRILSAMEPVEDEGTIH